MHKKLLMICLIASMLFTVGWVGSSYNFYDSGVQVFFNSQTFETVFPMADVFFKDDFIGADLVIPANGSDESGCKWTKDVEGSATCAKGADASNGTVLCSLTSAANTEEVFLCMDDQRNFTIGQGMIFEARVQLTTLPTTATTEIFIGMGNDTSGSAEVGNRICFKAAGSGLLYAELDDGTTETTVTTGTTVTASTWVILRIDAQSASNVKFYINGARVASGTTFNYDDNGTELTLQPWMGAYKELGPGLGVLTVDYVKIWQDRS